MSGTRIQRGAKLRRLARRIGAGLGADLAPWIWPAGCVWCGAGEVCDTHRFWVAPAQPRCLRCAACLPEGLAPGRGCGVCRIGDWNLDGMVVLGDYHGHAALRSAILAVKHGGRREFLPLLGAALAERWSAAAHLPAPSETLLVPVPLHPTRKWQRGFDQAAELAGEVAMVAGGEWRSVLYRNRATPPQGSLFAARRSSNVRAAFDVHPEERRRLPGARVLLVDDVCTSGATLGQAARVLRRNGARRVGALVLARVQPGQGQGTVNWGTETGNGSVDTEAQAAAGPASRSPPWADHGTAGQGEDPGASAR